MGKRTSLPTKRKFIYFSDCTSMDGEFCFKSDSGNQAIMSRKSTIYHNFRFYWIQKSFYRCSCFIKFEDLWGKFLKALTNREKLSDVFFALKLYHAFWWVGVLAWTDQLEQQLVCTWWNFQSKFSACKICWNFWLKIPV